MITTYADLLTAVADKQSVIQLGTMPVPGPVKLSGLKGITLDLSGATLTSTAVVTDPTMYIRSMIYLDNCEGCVIKGGVIRCAMCAHSAIGLHNCAYCEVEDVRGQGSSIGFGQFGSLGGRHNKWRKVISRNGFGVARGFWLGNDKAIEQDVTVTECIAEGMPATGIAICADGAFVQNNVSVDNQGAGICSSTSANGLGRQHWILDNTCLRNLFWGWQSDCYNGVPLSRVEVHGNRFLDNGDKSSPDPDQRVRSALLNLMDDFDYSGNEEDGIVQVCASSNGRAVVAADRLRTNGPANVNVSLW